MSLIRLTMAGAAAVFTLSCAEWIPVADDTPIKLPPPADLETPSTAASMPMTAAAASPASARASASVPGDLYQPDSAADMNLSCGEFLGLLKSARPSTVEELLAAIKNLRPKFLTRAVFAYQTKMPFDDATMAFPRAIVYGGDAKLILNFGGRHRQRSYERMETICFDDQQNKFDFFDLVFPKEAASAEALSDLTAEEKQLTSVLIPGGRGQRECKNCHQDNPRPNWDTSALWPGFYGAVDDTLKDRERATFRPTYATYETNNWQAFQSLPAKSRRYAFVSQPLAHANADFTLRLSYLNGRRIVGDLKRLGREFEPHKYELARALFCAPKGERRSFRQLSGDSSINASFAVVPENADADTKDIFLSSYYDEMQKERRLGDVLGSAGIPSPLPKEHFEQLRSYYRALFEDKDLNLDLRLSTVDVDEVLTVRELKRVTDKLGIDLENWSMVRDGGFVHENGMGGDGKVALRLILERPLMTEFFASDNELSSAVMEREAAERSYHTTDNGAAAALDAANDKICAILSKR